MSKKPKNETITSVADFLKKLSKLDKNKYDSFFYRGMTDHTYKLQPSLFRKTDYPAKEKLLMQELLSRQSSAFAEDKTMFERLVRAQHYELPTRLLDLTLNPLIALYFACANWKTGKPEKKSKKGRISVFCHKKDQIQYFDSHKTIILSNLAKLSQGQKDALRASKESPKSQIIKETEEATGTIQHVENKKVRDDLTSFIQNEYAGFRPEIHVEKLFPPILVIPQRNNDRIIAQQGAFILFGLDEQLFDEEELGQKLSGDIISYGIPGNKKKDILNELRLLGIHLNTLLPGIEHCSHFLMEMLQTEEKTPEESFNLGVMYYFGHGVKIDKKEAFTWMKQAADQGQADAQCNLGIMYHKGEGEKKDFTKAREYFQLAADQGDADAQFNLGVMYNEGQGGEKDLSKARKYFKKSADQGNAPAQCNLGIMYDAGQGGEKNPTKAREYFQKAADQENAPAQFNLAIMYNEGQGGEKDLSKVREYFKKAADQGHAGAQFNLAHLYLEGEGVEKDLSKAHEYFKKAADQGHIKAQFNLGLMYLEGEGGEKDLSKAHEYFKKAADQGHADAQYNLAIMYDGGHGGEKDLSKAWEYFQKAADQGNVPAQYNLGLMYLEGEGVEKDLSKAREYFQKAADQGNADAQCNLSIMYNEGHGGNKDLSKAWEYFQKAADQGNVPAQYNLGLMYLEGEGGEKDLTKAREYFQKAADQGLAEAIEALKRLDEVENKSAKADKDAQKVNDDKEKDKGEQ